jgi:hypothetical protein
MANNYVGTRVTVKTGAKIQRNGSPDTQRRASTVTIVEQEPARYNKTRVFWKSQGYLNSMLLS